MAIPTSLRNGIELAGAADSADDAVFIGGRDTDGSWKLYSNSGVCALAKRVSGAWEDKFELDGGDLTINNDITAAGISADTVVASESTNAGDDLSATSILATDITVDESESREVGIKHTSTPSDPEDGYSVMWVDSTTGDLMIKINLGGTVKTATIVDYSAV